MTSQAVKDALDMIKTELQSLKGISHNKHVIVKQSQQDLSCLVRLLEEAIREADVLHKEKEK